MPDDVRIETARVLDLKPGDILHVQLGIADMGDGAPWIPSQEEIHRAAEDWRLIVPAGVRVIVTHIGVTTEAICASEFEGDLGVVVPRHEGDLANV
jgi:hypothetical protein